METPDAKPDDHTIPGDTPTHRLHLMQMSIQQIQAWTAKLQTQRSAVVEKIKKAKANTNIARSLTVDKQFSRLVTRMESDLQGIEDDIAKVNDNLNRARALFFEASNGEVIMEKSNGDAEVVSS